MILDKKSDMTYDKWLISNADKIMARYRDYRLEYDYDITEPMDYDEFSRDLFKYNRFL